MTSPASLFATIARSPDCAFAPMDADEARRLEQHLADIVTVQGGASYFSGQSPFDMAYQIAAAGSKPGASLADILKAIGRE